MPPRQKHTTCPTCHLVYSELAEQDPTTVYTGTCPRCGHTPGPAVEEAEPEAEPAG
jgi:hypothetical protein